ncbi:plexin A [Mytilus galloprovincialis]|nr:plexin A [Mytilus galloprovincialis]
MLMTQVVKNVTNKLNEALTNAGHPEIASSFVQEKFNCLVNTHFLQRCKNRTNTSNSEDVTDDLYKIPVTGSRKRKHSTDNNPVSLKKRRILDSPEKEEPDDAGIYWKANFDRFHQYMRDQLMITAIASKVDKKAGEVLRTLLRVCELKSDPYSTVTNAVTLTEVRTLLRVCELKSDPYSTITNAVTLTETCFISKVDESGGGMFGSKCLRIFRVLLLKKHVEQKQIEDFAMISAKEAKELLYNMFSQKFITTSEIAKTPDHAPSRTFYLFKVDIHKLAQHVLERSYKAMYNATLRKDNELTEHRRLLDKQERVDAIIASIDQAGGDDTQKDEIEQTITPTERDQIDTVKRTVQIGGRRITVMGTNINIIDQPKMFIWINSVISNLTNCQVKNETFMFCPSPKLVTRFRRLKRSTEKMTVGIGFIMDNAVNVRNLTGINSQLLYFPDPLVYKFEPEKEDNDNVKLFKSEIVIINGKNLMVAAQRRDIQVAIGNDNCNVTHLSEDQIICKPPTSQPDTTSGHSRNDIPAVVVHIGNTKYFVGYLEYESAKELGIPRGYIIGGMAGVGLFILITIIVCSCIYKRQKNKSKRDIYKMRYHLDNMESNVMIENIEDMSDLTAEIGDGKKPLYKYDEYTFKILFPHMLDHVILQPPIEKYGTNDRQQDIAICHFKQLLQHKQFLLKFIRTLERQNSFGIRDKSNVASLLIILYQNNLEYITEIIKSLLKELVEKSVEGKHPKLMLLRTESVVEKLLANWLALCMYTQLKESAGSSLYVLYKALKFQVMKGPVDAVTGEAMYSLSEDRLLRKEYIPEIVTITLNVEFEGKKYKCRCLDCDTITQAKEKMLDVIYRNIPYSTRPAGEDLDLDLVSESKTLEDEDNMKWVDNGWRLNMLKDYKLQNGADVVLSQYQKCRPLPRPPNKCYNPEAVPSTSADREISTQYWHLVKQPDAQTKGISSEEYHSRLLATKDTLKQYIDDFIKTVLTASQNMPPAIKYLFDFLDDAAKQNSITDPEVGYTWKCNSLLLRFWVNVIKNPDFVFDIHKTNIVDSCMSVVAQCFMDSFSTSDQNLSKNSPSNKLFAKDIPEFKKSISKYLNEIQRMPAVSDQDLNAYLAEVSRMSTAHFTKDNALLELFSYVQKYSNELEITEILVADSLTEADELLDRPDDEIENTEGPSNA